MTKTNFSFFHPQILTLFSELSPRFSLFFLSPQSTHTNSTSSLPPMSPLQRLLTAASRSAAAARLMTAVACAGDPTVPMNLAQMKRRDGAGKGVHWIFLGCPGVGKGTYAGRLSQLLGVPHIATGDLVRQELASSPTQSSQLAEIVNQGKLVSDEVIMNLLSKRLQQQEVKGESGFILDGFPRTIRQAEIFEGVTDVDLVVNLKLREDVLLEKCLGRRICSQCGGNFNVAFINISGENGLPGIYMPPLLPPSQCTTKLISRPDDTEEVVKERLRIYYEMSQPVEEFYRSRGKLLEFDLPGGIAESWPKFLQVLKLEGYDDQISAAA